jgi:hypothetical protein
MNLFVFEVTLVIQCQLNLTLFFTLFIIETIEGICCIK